MNKWVFVSNLFLVHFIGLFLLCVCIVLVNQCVSFCFILLHLISLLSHRICFFPNERQKGNGSRREEKRKGTGRSRRGKGNGSQVIVFDKKNAFSIKGNNVSHKIVSGSRSNGL